MSLLEATSRERARRRWKLPTIVFGLVLAAQLYLIARIGTDIPFHDQWDAEGARLYPAWRDGTWHAADLVRPHNEHRILWTRLLDLGLFSVNGQWDPLVQVAADAVLRAAGGALLAVMLAACFGSTGRMLVGAGVVWAYLPHVAWQNAIWGFQSSVYFVLLFSLVAFALLAPREKSPGRIVAGLAMGVTALFALGAGVFVPVALLGLAALRAVERRRWDVLAWRDAWPALGLLVLAWLLRADAPALASLHATTPGAFFNTLGRAMAWPHTGLPAAAIVLNVPVCIAVVGRLARRRAAARGEDFVLLIAGWSIVAAGAMAWARGGGHEFDAGVTIRYVDLLIWLPVANVWLAATLLREVNAGRRPLACVLAGAWGVFLLMGWLGVSAQIMRGFILPRMHDRDLPVRLAVAFQQTDDPAVFAGQPPILMPHPNPASVRAALKDPRMKGALPPSFQPGQPMGPLSRAVRALLGRDDVRP